MPSTKATSSGDFALWITGCSKPGSGSGGVSWPLPSNNAFLTQSAAASRLTARFLDSQSRVLSWVWKYLRVNYLLPRCRLHKTFVVLLQSQWTSFITRWAMSYNHLMCEWTGKNDPWMTCKWPVNGVYLNNCCRWSTASEQDNNKPLNDEKSIPNRAASSWDENFKFDLYLCPDKKFQGQ